MAGINDNNITLLRFNTPRSLNSTEQSALQSAVRAWLWRLVCFQEYYRNYIIMWNNQNQKTDMCFPVFKQ